MVIVLIFYTNLPIVIIIIKLQNSPNPYFCEASFQLVFVAAHDRCVVRVSKVTDDSTSDPYTFYVVVTVPDGSADNVFCINVEQQGRKHATLPNSFADLQFPLPGLLRS